MAKITLEEKRRQSIYRQLYGKQDSTLPKLKETSKPQQVTDKIFFSQTTISTQKTQALDSTYLKKDLLKVLALTSTAIVIQLLLFFAQKNHLVNLKF